MPQLYDCNRNVLYNSGDYSNGPMLTIHELWNYIGSGPGYRDGEYYITGEYAADGEFRGESRINQKNILGYVEDCIPLIAKAKAESAAKYDELLEALIRISAPRACMGYAGNFKSP
jgi:hypothetical protein